MVKKILLLLILLFITIYSSAQASRTIYYKDKFLTNEATEEKGKYSVTTSINADSSRTIEVRNVKKNIIERSQTLKGNEPIGIWKQDSRKKGVRVLDYNFLLSYTDDVCTDSVFGVKLVDYFHDDASINYVAPKIYTGEKDLQEFLKNYGSYTENALELGIHGTAGVSFTVTENGEVINIAINKRANIWLEKEVMRVSRQLKFSTPARLKGKPISICVNWLVAYTYKM